MKMNENIQNKNEDAKRLIKVRPDSYTLNNFQFDKLYVDKIQIKNLMDFPLVLNIRSSDSKILQVAEKIVKLNGHQMVRVSFTIKIKTHIKTTCIRNMYIWLYNDLIDYKYYLTLNTRFNKVTIERVNSGIDRDLLPEIPELTEPVYSEMRESKEGVERNSNARNKPQQHITIEALSSMRNEMECNTYTDRNEENYNSNEYLMENQKLREENRDLKMSIDGLIGKTQELEDFMETYKSGFMSHEGRNVSQSPRKENNVLNRSSRSLSKSKNNITSEVRYQSNSPNPYNDPLRDSHGSMKKAAKKSALKVTSQSDFKLQNEDTNITALNTIKESYVDLLYNGYLENKKRNDEIITIMEGLIDLSNSNLSQFGVQGDYKKMENFEKISDKTKKIETLIRNFVDGIKFYNKHLINEYDKENLNRKLESGYLNIDYDSLQRELSKLDSFSNEIINLKAEIKRLEMENDYLKTNIDSGTKHSSDHMYRIDMLNNDITYLKAEGIKKQEIINTKDDQLYKKDEEIRQLRRMYEKVMTDKNSRISRDYIERNEVTHLLAEKDRTIMELKENLIHSSTVIDNLKGIVETKTHQINNRVLHNEHVPESHYVNVIETLKKDVRCKDQIIADLCNVEKRGHEIVEDLKTLSSTMKGEQLERTMNSLTEEIEKQKLRNMVKLNFIFRVIAQN
jgi:uncharacterized small protein (DUF1192 family)